MIALKVRRDSNTFKVKVGLHQESVLSLLLFILVPMISLAPTISLGSHQNIALHTGECANVVLLTYLRI